MKNRKIKNYLKLGILLFGISLILSNCEKESILETNFKTPIQVDAKTVSLKEAEKYFNENNNYYLARGGNQLTVTPDWNSFSQDSILYTDALISKTNTSINREGDYTSELLFIEINGEMKNVIFTIYKETFDQNGFVINATVYFNETDGTFLDAYKIKNGKFTKRLIPVLHRNIQQASFFPLFFFLQSTTELSDCWNTDTLDEFEGGVLGEVVITASSNGGGGSIPYIGYFSIINNAVDYGNNNDPWTSGGGGSTSNSISPSGITAAAAAILTIPPDENGNCPEGFTKNPTTNLCESNCTGNKVWNTTAKKCECPSGQVENSSGNCIKNPCSELKNTISDVPVIKTRLRQLRLVSGNFEKGLRVNKNPSTGEYVPSDILNANSGTHYIRITTNPYTVVIAHTHPVEDTYAMFSGPDIIKMAEIASRNQSNSNSTVEPLEITHILVVNGATFAMRFDDIESVQKLMDIHNDPEKRKDFNESIKDLYDSDYNNMTYQSETSVSKQQHHLFDLFEENNLNMSLYEANYDGNGLVDNWQKINKETLEKEPCN